MTVRVLLPVVIGNGGDGTSDQVDYYRFRPTANREVAGVEEIRRRWRGDLQQRGGWWR